MKEIKKRITVLFLVLFVLSTSINKPLAVAANSVVAEYGFKVPSTGYTWKNDFKKTYIRVYTSDNYLIGNAVSVVVRARLNEKDSLARHIDKFLIRTEMQPISSYNPFRKKWYHGINENTEAKLFLNNNQSHVNFEPKASMPVNSSTWDVKLGASSIEGNEIGFTLETGYSSTVKDNLFTVSTNHISNEKSKLIRYDYKVNNDFWSTQAKRETNKWANNNHQTYYAFTYTTTTSNRIDVVVDYASYFRYAISDSKTYDGSTWDVETTTRGKACSVTYIGSY